MSWSPAAPVDHRHRVNSGLANIRCKLAATYMRSSVNVQDCRVLLTGLDISRLMVETVQQVAVRVVETKKLGWFIIWHKPCKNKYLQ